MVTKIIDDTVYIKHVPDLGYNPSKEHGKAESAPHLKEQPKNVDRTSIVGEMVDRVFKLDRIERILGSDNRLREEDEESVEDTELEDEDVDDTDEDYEEYDEDEESDEEDESDEDFDYTEDEMKDDIELEWDEETPVEEVIQCEEIVKEFTNLLYGNNNSIVNEKNDAVLDDDDPDNDHYDETTVSKYMKKKKWDRSLGTDLEQEAI